jgi:hemerythrin
MIKTSELIWQDTQHQMLFRLIDEIRQEPFQTRVLVDLQIYAEQHFALEEAYMKALEYPSMFNHISAHDRFRKELKQLTERPEQMNMAVRQSLSLFLEEWLKRHIFGVDKDFEQFVLQSGQK